MHCDNIHNHKVWLYKWSPAYFLQKLQCTRKVHYYVLLAIIFAFLDVSFQLGETSQKVNKAAILSFHLIFFSIHTHTHLRHFPFPSAPSTDLWKRIKLLLSDIWITYFKKLLKLGWGMSQLGQLGQLVIQAWWK